jgi:hypothetical protein
LIPVSSAPEGSVTVPSTVPTGNTWADRSNARQKPVERKSFSIGHLHDCQGVYNTEPIRTRTIHPQNA